MHVIDLFEQMKHLHPLTHSNANQRSVFPLVIFPWEFGDRVMLHVWNIYRYLPE